MALLAELICDVPNAGKLQLMSLSASEGLSRPFEFQIEFVSPKPDLKLADFLGRSMTVELLLGNGGKRYFNGLVARFSQSGRRTRHFFHYQAVLRPALWFLAHSQDCRIFQKKAAMKIVSEVLGNAVASVNEVKKITDRNSALEYCVQYRESDLNFISRLLEQEGIYYYFKHSRNSHEIVFCDGPSSHSAFSGYETIPYGAYQARADDYEAIRSWSIGAQVLPSSVVLGDFDYLKPGAPLSANGQVKRSHQLASHEVFDYPGEYRESADGDHYAKVRAEAQQAGYIVASGTTDAHGLCCGHTFRASALPDSSQDVEYLVLSTNIYVEEGLQTGSDDAELGQFSCSFQAMPSSHTFRPPHLTPKPMVAGPQTAKVMGPSGEHVHTDEHGRVKVLFHWDRAGTKVKDDSVSCWVRVSQPWASKGFGMVNIPRVGDEVVVSFLEGDPDQPLVTGRVYNGEAKPPYELPANASITGVLTRSMGKTDATQGNELRFEDKAGAEYIWLQAQKDFHRHVENNDTDTVGADQAITVKGKRQESIGADLEQKVTGNVKTTYERDHHHKVTGDLLVGTNGVINLAAMRDFALEALNVHAKGKIGVTLEATASLTLKVGGSSIVISPASITIDAPMVSINGGGSGGSASAPAAPQAAQAPQADTDPLSGKKVD
jgi:type VI secretion system secreted protein VgrG